MKKLYLFLSFILVLACKIFAQDSLGYRDLRAGFGVSNAGIKMFNAIGSNFNFPDFGYVSQVSSFSYSVGHKKYVMEMGIDFGSKDKTTAQYDFQSEITNVRYSYKYRFINTKHSNLNLFGDFAIQSMSVQIDSINPKAKLLDFTSISILKSYITLGPGVEYIYKFFNNGTSTPILGMRASYNFYLYESDWQKAILLKRNEYPDRDLGYLQTSLFISIRFNQRK
jgi:hypothetical protein